MTLHRPRSASQDFFTVTVRWEYVTTPAHAQRRFVGLSDRDEYAELAHERGATSAWFFPALTDWTPARRSDLYAYRHQPGVDGASGHSKL